MIKLYYQLPGVWSGDCMPFRRGDQFYFYHQRDTRKPCPFGEPLGWDLSTTSGFVHYEDRGVAIPGDNDEEQDQFISARSVLKAEGMHRIFYTGYNRDYPKAEKPSQVLMYAVSQDPVTWTRTNEAPTFTSRKGYDPDDWHDSFVIRDQERGEYLLIPGARKMGPKTRRSGRTAYFTSKNLKDWEFHGDFWTPDPYTMYEMPGLFWIGDWWYRIISEHSGRNKIIYRMAKNIHGLWIAPADDAFDGRAYYAGRTFCLNGQRILFGWVSTGENCDDRGNFEWAGTFMAYEVYQGEDRTLGVKVSEPVWNVFNTVEPVVNCIMDSSSRRSTYTAAEHTGDLFRFEADVEFEQGTCPFGIRFYENEDTEGGYQYILHVGENRYESEKNSNWQWLTYMNIGLLHPIKLEAGGTYHIRMIVDDTIAALYMDGVALNTRLYIKPGEATKPFATDGTLKVANTSWAKGMRGRYWRTGDRDISGWR